MSTHSLFRYAFGALAMAAAAIAFPAASHAVTFNLTSDHCSGGCGTPPFGTVTVTQSGTNADISVSLADSNRFVLTGSADMQYFKFNGAPNLTNITVDQTAAGTHLIADTGSFTGDGTGNFAFGITCDTGICGNGGANALPLGTVLSFHVANTTVAALTGANNLGFTFVADILSGTTGQTGPVASTGSVPVPAPLVGAGLPGLVLACGGLIALARRRPQKIA
jgi:hypothetical protein